VQAEIQERQHSVIDAVLVNHLDHRLSLRGYYVPALSIIQLSSMMVPSHRFLQGDTRVGRINWKY
jgi:hypothetical protein